MGRSFWGGVRRSGSRLSEKGWGTPDHSLLVLAVMVSDDPSRQTLS